MPFAQVKTHDVSLETILVTSTLVHGHDRRSFLSRRQNGCLMRPPPPDCAPALYLFGFPGPTSMPPCLSSPPRQPQPSHPHISLCARYEREGGEDGEGDGRGSEEGEEDGSVEARRVQCVQRHNVRDDGHEQDGKDMRGDVVVQEELATTGTR